MQRLWDENQFGISRKCKKAGELEFGDFWGINWWWWWWGTVVGHDIGKLVRL